MAASRASRPRSQMVRQSRGARNLLILPVDILLKVFSTLSIRDVLNIRQTCRTFYEVTKSRSLWHFFIRRHVLQSNLPIPGLGNNTIDSLSSRDLERCTLQALRLRRIWTSRSRPTAKKLLITPIPDSQSYNVALQFLPGRDQCYLLSITAVTSDRTNWYAIQCWNVDGPRPVCVARSRLAELASFAVNTDPSNQAILALLVPQSVPSNDPNGTHKLIKFCSIEIYGFDFAAANGPESALVCMTSFHRRRFRQLHVFSGSGILCQDWDGRLIYWDINTPDTEAELRDTAPQTERCLAAVIHDDFAIVIRPSHFQIYPLGACRAAANSRTRTCVIQHATEHRWRWQVSNVCMSPYATTSAFPTITALIRFTSMGGWPDNVLHHFIIRPNPAFSRSSTINARNVPYSPLRMIQSFASPVLMHQSAHSALNRYGNAVWFDNHLNNQSGPEWNNAQRITGELLLLDDDDDDGSRAAAAAGVASPVVAKKTFGLQPFLGWRNVALDDTGSRIAAGSVDGKISVFQYA